MPNMHVWRPCDNVETAAAWSAAVARRDGPTSLVLTRQKVPHLARSASEIEGISRGGYIVVDSDGALDIAIIATGSEVSLACEAARQLKADGCRARVVSMPCAEVFDAQDEAYRRDVLPDRGVRLAVEAGASGSWWRYIDGRGGVIGIDRFGQSAPATELFEQYGFTVDSIVATARELIAA
jgi:transketolase